MTALEQPVVADWVAAGARPAGQPGRVGRNHGAGASWSYPAVKTDEGRVFFWRDSETSAGQWIEAPAGLAASFDADEDWKADCDHQHAAPWQTCAFEADCVALRLEEERTWGR
ncbi:hypothetical protein [Intrasporangium flavum]|uniref:hypothetical protein n=1 Tax=Intrasporangium flavum TaxID=1428657 RepID=UPI00096F47FB|nr:hypothetical protein [Intrasporangium flavum]